jgi:hypothetical protein
MNPAQIVIIILTVLGLTIGLAVLAGIVWLLILLAGVPGRIADRRGLDSADRIRVMGWIGLALAPLWLVALCWSLMERSPAGQNPPGLRRVGRLQSTTPAPPAPACRSGRAESS